MVDSFLIVIALEMACVVVLLIAIRAVKSRNRMRHPPGGGGSVGLSKSVDESVPAVRMLPRHDVIWDEERACEGYSYDDRPLSQNFPVTYLPPHEDSERGHTEDWLEQEPRFFYGLEWDRRSDWEKENAIGFMTLYALDMELFSDKDGDGLPDHPDWDSDFEDDGDLLDLF